MPDTKEILDWGDKAGGFVAGATAVLGVLYAFRNRLRDWIKKGRAFRKARYDIIEHFPRLLDSVQNIERELNFNGGATVKDAVAFLMKESEIAFWQLARPAFRCLSNGSNQLVSEAYCVLVGISREEFLSHLGWRQFIHEEDRDTYYDSWIDASSTASGFTHTARFQLADGSPRGKWRVRIVPLTEKEEDLLWVGFLTPEDDLALQISMENGWDVPSRRAQTQAIDPSQAGY